FSESMDGNRTLGADMRWVYGFEDLDAARTAAGGDWSQVRRLLGGKGANLADMTSLGVPVPPGFIITTEACNAYLAAGNTFPPGLDAQLAEALRAVEDRTGRRFGDPSRPL